MPRKPRTIDEFLEPVEPDKREALEQLRRTIRSVAPDAEECISYGIAAFRVRGAVVAGFAPTSKGCSYYPFSGSTLRILARDLKSYSQTKSALHFAADRPLPKALVRKLIQARLDEEA
jgi:uncharacterized protein YdhG (YjbR/CyaY superfamily)